MQPSVAKRNENIIFSYGKYNPEISGIPYLYEFSGMTKMSPKILESIGSIKSRQLCIWVVLASVGRRLYSESAK